MARLLGILSLGTKQTVASSFSDSARWPVILNHIHNRLHPGSVLILISDFSGFDAGTLPILSKIKAKAEIIVFKVSDPLEEAWPDLGKVGITYGGLNIFFDSNDKKLKTNYQKERQKRDEILVDVFKSVHAHVFRFMTNDNLDEGMQKILTKNR